MKLKQDTHNVAAIVARFQVPELTEAHKELIQTVLDEHPKVLIFLGLSVVRGSISNPLDFAPRKQMIAETFPAHKYPNLTVGYIKDSPSDDIWTATLDKLINDHLSPNDTVVLYGGRDSFLPHYKGTREVRELISQSYVSGSEIRRKIAAAPQSDPMFRTGAIWATHQRHPMVYSTVDIAVLDALENKVLLARKPDEHLFRFVGGFVSPTDDSFEAAASRELYEETTLSVGNSLKYIASYKVDDWRYRNEVDKIITHFYIGHYVMGAPQARDDIAEVKWFGLDRIREVDVVPQHRMMLKTLIDYIQNKEYTDIRDWHTARKGMK